MLQIENLCGGYDSVDVLHGVCLSVRPGSIVAVIGANGAGKSTLLRAVSGLVVPSSGSVSVDGLPLDFRSGRGIVKAGVAHVPEGRQVFSNMTVTENLRLGAYTVSDHSAVDTEMERVLDLFPVLRSRLDSFAGSLSGGQQQMLAIARGLMAGPRYLLLDEPSLGLAPQVIDSIFAVIAELRARGVGILLVEQNGRLALSLADEGCLLEQGCVTLSGTGRSLLEDPEVVQRYLGVGASMGGGGRQRLLAERLRRALIG
ncbi:MAG TPA: ABC transporter ATP-binding protein [Acidimicrobiales bacterium]|nr:ABC transporter ATP-binding protein [Acidimicrobiales bacterium]